MNKPRIRLKHVSGKWHYEVVPGLILPFTTKSFLFTYNPVNR